MMKYRVFLIDDEIWVIRGLLKRIDWETLGYEVVYHTTDSNNILEEIDFFHPDVIITDIKMPVVTGIDIIHNCSHMKEKPEVILISAYEEFSYAHEALKYGAFDYLLKPIKNANLIECLTNLKAVLGGRRQNELRDTEQQILKNKLEITPQKLFEMAGVKVQEEKFCIICFAKSFFGGNQVASIFFDMIPKEKVVIQSDQFFYLIFNMPMEKIYNSKIIEELDSYMVHVGISSSMGRQDVLYPHIKQASCAALQFLINQKHVITRYEAVPRLQDRNAFLKNLQTAFVESRGDLILKQIKYFREHSDYSIVDLIDIGNYISMNLCGVSEFEENGLMTLERFQERYHSVEEYCSVLEDAVSQAYQELSGGGLDIEKVKAYIQTHYMESCKIEEIAQHFHVDEGYLGRKFKKAYGQNIKDYIQETRMEKAKNLLVSTNRKVYEVSEAVGYTDYFYFARVFKKLTGESANDYRENHGQNEEK